MRNINKVIKKLPIYLLICLFVGLFIHSNASAGPQSTTYELKEWDFGSGGTTGNTSTTYSLFGNSGQFESGTPQSTTYQLNGGLTYLLQANVPTAPTVSNEANIDYNKLNVTINTASNPTDTLYAIQVVSSGTQYVQADDTLGGSPVWQTNTVWGASGFHVIGLTQGTSYTFSVAAKQGNYTQTQYGPSTTVSTATPTFSLSVSPNSVAIGTLNPGTVVTSPTTVTTTVSTNGTNGATIYVYDNNAGLLSSSTGYTISALSGDLSSASQGYGIQGTSVSQTTGGPMEILSPFNVAGTNVGLVNTTKQSIFDSTSAPVTSGQAIFSVMAKAGNTASPATDYTDTLTVIASATF